MQNWGWEEYPAKASSPNHPAKQGEKTLTLNRVGIPKIKKTTPNPIAPHLPSVTAVLAEVRLDPGCCGLVPGAVSCRRLLGLVLGGGCPSIAASHCWSWVLPTIYILSISLYSLHCWVMNFCTATGQGFINNIDSFWHRRDLYKIVGIHPNSEGTKKLTSLTTQDSINQHMP